MITNYSKVAFPPPLDMVDGAAAAIGLRKLSTNWYGKCCRIRRSSDNAEQDIDFRGLDFDVTAFSAFIGTGSGYITTIYDQSGNGHDATQAMAANQPVITLNVQNGRPVIKFTAISQTFLTFGTILGKPANYTNVSAFSISNTNNVMYVLGSGNSTSNGVTTWGGLYMNRVLGSPNRLPLGCTSYFHSDGTNGMFDTMNAIFTPNLMGIVCDSYESGLRTGEIRKNGVIASALDTNGPATSNTGLAYEFSIGRNGEYAAGSYFDGYYADFIHYSSKLTDSNQAKIERSYNDYYAIF